MRVFMKATHIFTRFLMGGFTDTHVYGVLNGWLTTGEGGNSAHTYLLGFYRGGIAIFS